jgi:hypothetical protein
LFDVDAGHAGQSVFSDRVINVAVLRHSFDRDLAVQGRDSSMCVGKTYHLH